MPAQHLIPDHVRKSLPPEVIRAVELALSDFAIPDPVLTPDVKAFAKAIRKAGLGLSTEIKYIPALNAAALTLVGRPWQDAERSLATAPAPFSISLYVLGGQHRPQVFPIASIGEMADGAIKQILQQAQASRGAVIDIERFPSGLKITAVDRDRPTFVIECRSPLTPEDQAHFMHRLVDVLGERAPALLVNNALLPANPKQKPYTQAFFQLNAAHGPYRSGRLVGELDLAEQFHLLHVPELGEHYSDTTSSRLGAVKLQVGFRTYNQPFPRDYAPVTAAQLATLVSRYIRWRDAVGPEFAELVATLKARRRSPPLAAAQLAHDRGRAALAVHVRALLP
ncbi:hypothetical protein [Massilia cavernae]|uniref:Uncharacterized protein n=1 Tax=Massilia cavernae TaxID=2320864 RepID=A0A418XFT6_9BURK|nr:hypothetical protein [Massilia cavernae]RJG11321.1 hypothetical protein D3872_20305 [Massilia cavernae]